MCIRDREWVIYAFAAAYLLVLCLVGGKQGLKGALGLVFTFFCILFVYLPLVYRGWSPFWVAVLICIVTTLVTMYLIGGPTRKTVVAAGGTVAGVVIAGLAATLFSLATGITGWNEMCIRDRVAVTNVIVLKTACRYTGDSLGHITVDLSSGGTGYFACGGKGIDLTWSKDFPDGQLQYYDLSGSPISFGVGRTYVVIVPLDCAVSFE